MYTEQWTPQSDRQPEMRAGLTPWVKRLLIVNVVIFFLDITLFLGGNWLRETFAASASTIVHQPWTVVTYAFLHGNVLHIAFNMFVLYLFGTPVERRMGSSTFIKYYIAAAVGGALLHMAIVSDTWVIGASGAVMGLALAFAMYWPDARLMLFPIPIPIKAKYFVLGLALFDLTLGLLGASNGIARFAHLGGLLTGLLYFKALPIITERSRQVREEREATRVLVHQAAMKSGEHETPAHRRTTGRARQSDSVSDDVDRVLEKISTSGMDSLTADELRLLNDVSRELRSN